MNPVQTKQEKRLIESGCCAGVIACALGLSFADRDGELIQYLATLASIPDATGLPTRQACVSALDVSDRWASMVLERVGQFMRKAARGQDYSEPYRRFANLTQVQALNAELQRLPIGTSFFIGDSNMDARHWSSDAPYPILAGTHLQRLGRGDFINAGVGGETARQGLARFGEAISNHSPVRTVMAFGTNDLAEGRVLTEILQTIGELVQRSLDLGSRVVLQGVVNAVSDRLWWLPQPPAPDAHRRTLELNQALRTLSLKLGIGFVDVAAIVNDGDRCSDGIHFNQIGQEKIALLLLDTWAKA